jgi:hypothetical protein
VKFATDSHVMRLSICELREKRLTESYTLLAGINEFLSILSTVLSDLAENRHMILLNICGVFVNSEGKAVLCHGRKKKHIYAYIKKHYNILKVKKSFAKSM